MFNLLHYYTSVNIILEILHCTVARDIWSIVLTLFWSIIGKAEYDGSVVGKGDMHKFSFLM